MDWNTAKNLPKGLGLLLSLALLASLLSFHLGDPTLTNLRAYSEGIRNLLGLPGALIGGSLLEFLGTSALAAPLLVLNWFLAPRNRPPLYWYFFWSSILLAGLSSLHGLLAPSGDPGLLQPGLAGWSMRRWVGLTIGGWGGGVWGGSLILLFLTGYAGNRVLYLPAVRAAFRDLGIFTGWFTREGRAASLAGWKKLLATVRRIQRGLVTLVTGIVKALAATVTVTVAALLGAVWKIVTFPFRIFRRGTAGRGAAVPGAMAAAGLGKRPGTMPETGLAADGAFQPAADPFDAWIDASLTAPATEDAPLPDSPPEIPSSEPENSAPEREMPTDFRDPSPHPGETAPTAPSPDLSGDAFQAALDAAGEGAEGNEGGEGEDSPAAAGNSGYRFDSEDAESAWRERFQRYARNLDLDWEEQLWGEKEGEEEVEEEGEEDERPWSPPGTDRG